MARALKFIRRFLLWAGAGLGALVLALAAAIIVTAQPGDPALFPARDENVVEVYFVSHGYHSGIVLPRGEVMTVSGSLGYAALINVAARFSAYDFVEVGWGEERFYREVRTVADLNWRLALSALFAPGNKSVLHVVGFSDDVASAFPASDIVALRLSREGFRRLLAGIAGSFVLGGDESPVDLGPGLYGPSLFYRANGTFNLLDVCNHWTARQLAAAGVPTAPVAATLPLGLILDLKWRSGLRVLPRRHAASQRIGLASARSSAAWFRGSA